MASRSRDRANSRRILVGISGGENSPRAHPQSGTSAEDSPGPRPRRGSPREGDRCREPVRSSAPRGRPCCPHPELPASPAQRTPRSTWRASALQAEQRRRPPPVEGSSGSPPWQTPRRPSAPRGRTPSTSAATARTALTTASAPAGVACPTSGGTGQNQSYDTADRLVSGGRTYDAFGRITTQLGGTGIEYYANDLVHRETVPGKRQTWQLDAAHRFRSWTVESGSGSTVLDTRLRLGPDVVGAEVPTDVLAADRIAGAVVVGVGVAAFDRVDRGEPAGDARVGLGPHDRQGVR